MKVLNSGEKNDSYAGATLKTEFVLVLLNYHIACLSWSAGQPVVFRDTRQYIWIHTSRVVKLTNYKYGTSVMEYLIIALKLIVGLSILNVWLVRSKKPTPFRGGSARNIEEEFKAYGLPVWFMHVIGTLKVILAILLIASIFYPQVEAISAYGIAFLMLGAVFMHIKISDPLKKSFPAFTFLVFSLIVALI